MVLLLVLLPMIIDFLIGAGCVSLFFSSIDAKEGLVVGVGYYNLSSILTTEISSVFLGTVALLSNILRELITLVTTPLFVRYFGKLAGIVSRGATSMDSTLPIIVEYKGKEWAGISIFSGLILTIIVPILAPFILAFS